MGLFLSLLLVAQANEGSWFYPGRGAERVELTPTGDRWQVGNGHQVGLTSAILVNFDTASAESLMTDGRILRAERMRGSANSWKIWLREGVDPLGFSRQLHDSAGVGWAHPDFEITLHPTALDDTYWDTLWHLENTARYPNQVAGADVRAVEAWTVTSGSGTLIAILDTGVDLAHEDLDVVLGYDYIDGDEDPSPVAGTTSYAHGTAVAGIAAAIGDNAQGVAGVAYGAQILPIRIIGEGTTLSDVHDAFWWATSRGADVLSNSWSLSASQCDEVPLYAALQEGIAFAVEEGRDGLGAAVVFGSGNGGCDIAQDGLLAYGPVVAVGASDDRDRVLDYSNYGEHLDVVAPSGPASGGEGEYIRSTDITGPEGYPPLDDDAYTGSVWGTSASTPMVSGVLALIFSANPRLTQAEARQILCETADRIDETQGEYDESGWSPYYGCGRVNAGAAVAAALDWVFPVGDTEETGEPDTEEEPTEEIKSGCACRSPAPVPGIHWVLLPGLVFLRRTRSGRLRAEEILDAPHQSPSLQQRGTQDFY
jgi:subtilisin family serine protease